jgi:hypothetical protein
MGERRRKPSKTRPPDIEIGATVRADRIRFDRSPETDVEFVGRSVAEDESGSERVNLPDEVEPGKTYRDITVGWRAAAWVEDVDDDHVKEAREDGEDR